MIVRVIKAYGPYSVGHEFPEMPSNQARYLIDRNLVEEVKAIRAPVDRMMRVSDEESVSINKKKPRLTLR